MRRSARAASQRNTLIVVSSFGLALILLSVPAPPVQAANGNGSPVATMLTNGAAETTVPLGDPVNLSIGLDTGNFSGADGDWWFVKISQGAVFSFNLGTLTFVAGLEASLQAPIVDFPPIAITAEFLAVGEHVFCFGVDLIMNGALDPGALHYSCARAVVTASANKPTMSCSSNTDTSFFGINPFNPTFFQCGSDCPAGWTCDTATCLCEPLPEPKCAPPVFKSYYEIGPNEIIPPMRDVFDVIAYALDLNIVTMFDLDPLLILRIPATSYMEPPERIFPFPILLQFDIDTKTYDAQDFALYGHYCANEHLEGLEGLDVNLNWIPRPDDNACGFGSLTTWDNGYTVPTFGGILEICVKDLVVWMEEFLNPGGGIF